MLSHVAYRISEIEKYKNKNNKASRKEEEGKS